MEPVELSDVQAQGLAAAPPEPSGTPPVDVDPGFPCQLSWPAAGRLTSPFGWRRDPFSGRRAFHGGIDIGAPLGAEVSAARHGCVARVAINDTYGRFIVLDHGAGALTLYAHLSSVDVAPGDHLPCEASLGTLGLTGRTTGPHLHFELRQLGRFLDPLRWL